MRLKRAVFFDRDGVLNHSVLKDNKPYPPRSLEELIIPEDAFAALSLLKERDFLLIGATNQPDVPRGKTTKEMVLSINAALMQRLPLEQIRVCFHDDSDQCQCRKPAPGLLLEAAKDYNIDLTASYMIGDRWKDIAAGKQAGCKTIWLKSDYNESQPENADYTAQNLLDAAKWIVGKDHSHRLP